MKSLIYRYIQYLIAVWIAFFEGYFTPGTKARINRNPGNLRGWDPNNPKDQDGFDIFATAARGWDALFRQVEKNIDRQLTVREFFVGKPGVYPGYDASNPESYARFISEKTGLPLDSRRINDVIRTIEQRFNL